MGRKSTSTLHERLNSSYLKYTYVDKNLSQAQIAERVGCGTSSVVRALKRHGICKDKRIIYKQIDDHRRRTFRSRYGSEHYMQSKSGYNKYKKRICRSLGVGNIMRLDEVRTKVENTHISRYGVRFSIQNPASNRRRIGTLNKRYGDYKLYLSKLCALNHRDTSPNLTQITTRLGNFRVRSSLEAHVIKMLCKMPEIHSMKYEPLVIKLKNGYHYVPDLLVNKRLILEIKYHKYVFGRKPKNLDSRGICMWKSARRKLPFIQDWCKGSSYDFGIITERDLKHKNLRQLIANLKIFCGRRSAS